ncbi:MAG TPA: hypothetical protein ENN08_07185 [Bacteroidales bacterium]|nr:hypothetical protein [Bacteroidales bacterium]
MTKGKTNLAGEVRPEHIAEWKKKFGKVFHLQIEDKHCYLRKPDRNTLAYAISIAQTSPLEFGEVILKNCWLAGDEEIRSDDAYFLAALGKLDGLVEIKAAELKNL